MQSEKLSTIFFTEISNGKVIHHSFVHPLDLSEQFFHYYYYYLLLLLFIIIKSDEKI